ncbi:hypothetical protein NDU88_007807 [Pleurodeles waltl]|uniref:DUF4371 domain-containing protein n=1 Tax=Pleurodeles waltl TaxID=8319 RepID=A0AAV7VUP9_PLEWA|nr:hypothetical protein NDU88_007807 [Pleurodeles waltl]
MPVPPKVSVATDRGPDREQRECSQGKCDRSSGDANNGNGRTALTPCAVVPWVDREHIPRAATRTRMPTSAHCKAMQQFIGLWTLVLLRSSGVGELSPQLGLGQRCSQQGALNNIQSTILGLDRSVSQLNEAYHKGVIKHNEEVDKNHYILSKLIDCVKFCGAFELALRGHDETEESLNPGAFRRLVDFVSSIDSAMKAHLKSETVFKGTSKTIQNELLDCMLEVTRETIVQQLRRTDYVAIQANDATDVSTKTQSVLVFRYIDGNSKVVERLYCFSYLKDSSADTISAAILNELNLTLPERSGKEKLIAQRYDGASVMSDTSGGVKKKSEIYTLMHIMSTATPTN